MHVNLLLCRNAVKIVFKQDKCQIRWELGICFNMINPTKIALPTVHSTNKVNPALQQYKEQTHYLSPVWLRSEHANFAGVTIKEKKKTYLKKNMQVFSHQHVFVRTYYIIAGVSRIEQ